MASATSTVKRQNHRVHPCKRTSKDALLKFLLSRDDQQSVLIVTAHDPEAISKLFTDESVTVLSDTALLQSPELQCDLLISYDLPDSGDIYMNRLTHATKSALILLTGDEQQLLYPVETLLGRTLIQEVITGFEPDFGVVAPVKEKSFKNRDKEPQRENKHSDKKRSDSKRNDKTFKKEDKRPARKEKPSHPKAPVSDRPARKITGKSFKQHKESK
jgi:hypothetical protein